MTAWISMYEEQRTREANKAAESDQALAAVDVELIGLRVEENALSQKRALLSAKRMELARQVQAFKDLTNPPQRNFMDR